MEALEWCVAASIVLWDLFHILELTNTRSLVRIRSNRMPPVELNLPEMPEAIAALPRDERGYPTPWFTAEVNGSRSDLRIADGSKRVLAFNEHLCWVCGGALGKKDVVFVGGPMAVANRRFQDWASHPECARFSVAACPALNGVMRRRPGKEYPPDVRQRLGHLEQLPPLVGLYYTLLSRGVELEKMSGIFLPGPLCHVHWYEDGTKISDQTARPILRKYLEELGVPKDHSAWKMCR